MMTQAFYTGIIGLQSHQTAIDIVSDNLANIDTPGFRGNSAEFSSMFEKVLNTTGQTNSGRSYGLGVDVNATVMNLNQGSLFISDRNTDLAIDGDGWFGIYGNGDTQYTRAGNFTFDANSDLVTADDAYFVLGTMGNNINNGVLTNVINDLPLNDVKSQEKLNFPNTLLYPVEPTTKATFIGNLGTGDGPVNVSAAILDSQADRNQLKLSFTKSELQNASGISWDVTATTQSLDGETVYDTTTGIVEFDERGAMSTNTLGSIDNNGTSVAIDLGAGFTGITAIANIDASLSSSSNGLPAGDLLGYEINKNAEVVASFSNGRFSSVGKVALFHFQNDQGLERVTGTRYLVSPNSGEALFFKDANGNTLLGAKVVNFKTEGSNVEMERGLTELIILQRSYDANSKSITTADQMMQKALSMDA